MTIRNKILIAGCGLSLTTALAQNPVTVRMNLNAIQNDRLQVEMEVGKVKTDELTFYMPMTIPGTYSIDNYGRFISNVKGYDSKGKAVQVERNDNNTWTIKNAKKLAKLTYTVDDTFDYNSEEVPFGPAGTQIDQRTFLLNLHAFVGYFKGQLENQYTLEIQHPENLYASSSAEDTNPSNQIANYRYNRYFEVMDNPVFFTQTPPLIFKVDGVEIILAVHSPTQKYKPADFEEAMRRMIKAQLDFIGPLRTTNRYAILLYLASDQYPDVAEFGALEHHKNTTVVFPEAMSIQELTQQLIDTVSHEFFHILTPLALHSDEIHFFDYNAPKMSEHLWLYEGVTEYFANLFQIQQGIINEEEFLERMTEKYHHAMNFTDDLSFTEMSKNVLITPYSDEYLNVYSKGALIGMCIDILMREHSKGERGLIDLIRQLSQKYGVESPFKDANLFNDIAQFSNIEVQTFLEKHVRGGAPIPYTEYLSKMGVGSTNVSVDTFIWDNGNDEMILDYKGFGQYLHLKENMQQHRVVQTFGLEAGDQIMAINGVDANILSNFEQFLKTSIDVKSGDEVSIKIIRGGEQLIKQAILQLPKREMVKWTVKNADNSLRKAWLNLQN